VKCMTCGRSPRLGNPIFFGRGAAQAALWKVCLAVGAVAFGIVSARAVPLSGPLAEHEQPSFGSVGLSHRGAASSTSALPVPEIPAHAIVQQENTLPWLPSHNEWAVPPGLITPFEANDTARDTSALDAPSEASPGLRTDRWSVGSFTMTSAPRTLAVDRVRP